MSIGLILSGALISSEMRIEYGNIVPSFLPIENKRLFERQVQLLKRFSNNFFISLPDNYTISEADLIRMEELELTIIRTPSGLDLGNAILHCIELLCKKNSNFNNENFYILHGDTLLNHNWEIYHKKDNIFSVVEANLNYPWGFVKISENIIKDINEHPKNFKIDNNKNNEFILAGFFKFKSPINLKNALKLANTNFIRALSIYVKKNNVFSIVCLDWSDFGHLFNYYKSKEKFFNSRKFNSLYAEDGIVYKYGQNKNKISFEKSWFANLPNDLKVYSCRLINYSQDDASSYFYSLEYEFLPSLQELVVFGDLAENTWRKILASLSLCVEKFVEHKLEAKSPDFFKFIGHKKTQKRLSLVGSNLGITLEQHFFVNGEKMPSIRQMADSLLGVIDKIDKPALTIIHGDLCFSNILYDQRSEKIKLLDPRGTIDDATASMYGDFRYDMAKISHSVFGEYDMIVTDRYSLSYTNLGSLKIEFRTFENNSLKFLKEFLKTKSINGVKFDDYFVMAIVNLLFLTMIPLHSESKNRQMGFLATSAIIFKKYFGDLR